ncbi:MAG: histidine--tRNA ligase [Nanobdellota archaeon]
MELANAKGTKDYLPEEMIILNEIMTRLRIYFERAGFNPLTTPAIEKMDVLGAKYAGGSEILKETFQFKDQGERELGLRYDLTVPFARVTGQNPELKFPFKRYQMEKVYRDGPVGPGRYREFWQCDIDMVGTKSMKAEAEVLSIAEEFFKSYDFNPLIKLNNRKIMNSLLDNFKIDNKTPVILVIDKFLKMDKKDLVGELIDIGYEKEESSEIIDLFESLSKLDSNEEKIKACKKMIKSDEGKEGIEEIEQILTYCNNYGLSSVRFDPILARGLNYYTGPVFETVLEGNKITSCVCAGGRFDKMIGDFLESKEEFPAVGLSFGVSRIFDALIADNKIKNSKTVTQVLVISMNQDKFAMQVTKKLRSKGINTEIDIMERKIRKNLDYANGMKIPFAVIIGENEVESGKITLKNLDTGEQKNIGVEEAGKIILNT